MARNEIRPIVKLRSTAGTGYTYVTRKNRRNDPDRLVLTKYDLVIRRHVEFREHRRAHPWPKSPRSSRTNAALHGRSAYRPAHRGQVPYRSMRWVMLA